MKEEDQCKIKNRRYPKTIVKHSTIRGAGLGLFAGQDIAKHQLINQYKGKKLTFKQFSKLNNQDYVWEVLNKQCTKVLYYLDGRLYKKNNPLRYVNGARTKTQFRKINAFVVQRNNKLYYCAMRKIPKYEEIIISYGDYYW